MTSYQKFVSGNRYAKFHPDPKRRSLGLFKEHSQQEEEQQDD